MRLCYIYISIWVYNLYMYVYNYMLGIFLHSLHYSHI